MTRSAAIAAVGIDMGVIRFATLSDGTFYAPLNSFKRLDILPALKDGEDVKGCCGA